MERHLEVQGFDFSVVPEGKRERAKELDVQCGTAIQRLSYTVDEIGEICTEMKGILPYGYFIPWYNSKGLTHNQVVYATKRVREREQSALGIVEIVENQLFRPPQQASIPERAVNTHEQDEEIAKQITTAQHEAQIAQNRLAAAEVEIAYKNRQIEQAQEELETMQAQLAKQATEHPKIIEVEKPVEVIPQHLLDEKRVLLEGKRKLEERLRELQTQKTNIQAQAEQVKKERDLYKRDLDKERQSGNALFLQNLEPKGSARLHANFAEVMREIVAWSSASRMKLPSVIDTQSFEVEQWQRLEEAIQAQELLGRELHKLKNTVSSPAQQQSFIVDSMVTDTDLIVR